MAERMTSIYLPGMRQGAGLADWGRKTPAEMIASLRAMAHDLKAEAEAILAAADEDFHVRTYVGVHRQKNTEILQEGKRTTAQEG